MKLFMEALKGKPMSQVWLCLADPAGVIVCASHHSLAIVCDYVRFVWRQIESTTKFLKNDGKVLRFYCMWDDANIFGEKRPYVCGSDCDCE